MKRAIILMMDSFGCGEAPDADKFGDVGADTLGHIAKACAEGKAENGRTGPLKLPNLCKLGLGELYKQCNGEYAPNMQIPVSEITAAYGYSKEVSKGKDTTSGHWEMAGVPVTFKWGYFPSEYPSFPLDLIDEFCKRANLKGVLGNKAASGTVILEELGEESIKTGMPIVYTSADSVFQICAHEKHFGLERLYEICHIARDLLNERTENGVIARVIARPFDGETKDTFKRTGGRHDYSVLPPAPTVLDKMKAAGGNVISIGKISDIFAAQGITKALPAVGLEQLFDVTLEQIKTAPDNSIIFPNFVNFDMDWGHRRNVSGYASGLEYFDSRLPELFAEMKEGDIYFITADHGCDPTFKGSDHTREHVPVIMFGKGIEPRYLGRRETYSDIGQTIAEYFGLEPFENGKSFLNK